MILMAFLAATILPVPNADRQVTLATALEDSNAAWTECFAENSDRFIGTTDDGVEAIYHATVSACVEQERALQGHVDRYIALALGSAPPGHAATIVDRVKDNARNALGARYLERKAIVTAGR
jgi:hypothetical protein